LAHSHWVGYRVYLRHGTSVWWHLKTRLESGPVTVDLTTTVVHSSKLLINDGKPDHSLTTKRKNEEEKSHEIKFFTTFFIDTT